MKSIQWTSILLLVVLVFSACQWDSKKLFLPIPASTSQITFNNTLIENDSLSILDNEFFYNGAGLALGDLNQDGLLDVFFAGNQVDNQLYLNQGKMQFKNSTALSKVNKPNSLIWSSGVNIVDINADGRLDIYVCNTLRNEDALRKNLLYINLGNDDNGVPQFKESAAAYGLDDTTYSSHAQFFDFDNDGDLDVFIGVNRIENIDPNVFQNLQSETAILSKDKLYENQGTDSLGHPYFKDISKSANINLHGFSHSTLVQDINNDGWLDLYVANDYLSNDLVYINNGDKTFTNQARSMFKHFSLSSMGSDFGDVNNDGKLDLFVSEMQPYYNKRKKLFQKGTSYTKEILTRKYDYEYQYPRNVLQLNQGTDPHTGLPRYSDIGMSAGVSQTDWSWASLFADFDNDGWSDLLIVNGFPKDIIDKDFGDFRVTANRLVSREKLLSVIPEIKVPNFAFKNMGNLQFSDQSTAWGMDFPTYTNGAVYGDLDNDGDLDLVLNNINDPAILLENTSEQQKSKNHYIRFDLKGKYKNQAPYGARLKVYSQGWVQTQTLLSGRGYLSQPEATLHFGLGNHSTIDSVEVIWPDGSRQSQYEFKLDQLQTLVYDPVLVKESFQNSEAGLFEEVSAQITMEYKNEDDDFVDFNLQITLPHKFSQYGPALAVGDLNQDGREDLLIGGSRGKMETLFYQSEDGRFEVQQINLKAQPKSVDEDAGIALFDVENDGDLDIYVAHGSGQYAPRSFAYDDALWLNDGKGNFTQATIELPTNGYNASCAKAADFDGDGDMDLFVGTRVVPGQYPVSERSFLLENISENGKIAFRDASDKMSTGTDVLGLVTDALWTDFNNDGWMDLIVAGEWMPITFFENQNGQLQKLEKTGIENATGWWNSLSAADLDNDGDLDYVAGNFGTNTFYQGNAEEPITIIAKDFDANGSVDPFISFYLRDSLGQKHNYPYHPWEDVVKQFRALRKSFNSYAAYGAATLEEVFENQELSDAIIKQSNWMESSWIENLGNQQFKLHKLPVEVQWAPVFATLPFDVDQDGYQDIILVGNDYGVEVHQGRSDALQGLVLKNNGKGGFIPLSMEDTHFVVPGDAKSLVLLNQGQQPLFIASQNNDVLKVYQSKNSTYRDALEWKGAEVKCIVSLPSGGKQLQLRQAQNSFQSQGSSSLWIPKAAIKVEFYDASGNLTRTLEDF